MCGIAGVYLFDGKGVDFGLLRRMNDLMTHRGPDAEGFYQDRHVGLAMRRLKVIDLASGDQPIHDEDQSLWVVFNGEIYNYRELRKTLTARGHRFYTHSDTEVIAHQYQEEKENCLHSFVGMFAMALYDVRSDSLFIARDRLGIKPLFYHESAEGVAFASEIKPLLECPWVKRKLNLEALNHYLSLNYLPAPWTMFEGIKQLEPGHWMHITRGKVVIRPYWEIPLESPVEESEKAALTKIEELFHRSIERRLIADVPLGAFLSGGLDSSSLVALVKEHREGKLKTFSVGFEDVSYDETPYAREMARYFGTEHYEIQCGYDDVVQNLPHLAWHADNPLADQAALPLYLVSKLAKKHITVCLSGDGGDEVFVGYPTFHANRLHAVYSKIPRWLRRSFIDPWVENQSASNNKLSFDYRAKKFVEASDFSGEKAHYWWRTIFTEEEKKRLFRQSYWGQIRGHDSFSIYETWFQKAAKLDFPSRCLFADQKVWLAGNNLYKVDAMTMAHGLEARVPFLDHELVEYMARLPFRLKFRHHTLKYLLKKAMKSRLPDLILNRKKAGWHTPIAGWFRGPLRGFVRTRLLEMGNPVLDEMFERSCLQQIVAEHFSGRHNHAFKIWGLLTLYGWADHFLGSPTTEPEIHVKMTERGERHVVRN